MAFSGILADERVARTDSLRLERTGAIEGRLRNQDGEGIFQAYVSAFRQVRIGARGYRMQGGRAQDQHG